jgi:hypothetical protein
MASRYHRAMGKRCYTATRSGSPSAQWLLELDEDGTFHYGEEESTADYSMGADAWGLWAREGAQLTLNVTKSDFSSGRGAWRRETTERGTIEGDVVLLEEGGLSLSLVDP